MKKCSKSNLIKEVICKDWWESLKFFLAHACFQGRRDDVSQKVYDATIEVLETKFLGVQDCCLNYLKDELLKRIGKGKIGKARDVDMVIDIINFICKLPERNLIAYSISHIRNGTIEKHYKELQTIIQVGPKISSFYLRDVVSLYRIEELCCQ